MIKKINEDYEDYKEQKINKIIKLYEGELPEETIRKLASFASIYGGTILTKVILDLYDSIIYDEEPRGPNVDIKKFF